LVSQIVEKVKGKGQTYLCLGKTDVSVSVLPEPRKTVNALVYKHVLCKGFKGWLILDEYSRLEANMFFNLCRPIGYCKFIVVGDIHRLCPVNSRSWLDAKLDENI